MHLTFCILLFRHLSAFALTSSCTGGGKNRVLALAQRSWQLQFTHRLVSTRGTADIWFGMAKSQLRGQTGSGVVRDLLTGQQSTTAPSSKKQLLVTKPDCSSWYRSFQVLPTESQNKRWLQTPASPPSALRIKCLHSF